MGYVHDTQMKQFISPSEMMFEGGTWSDLASSSLPEKHRAQEADVGGLMIPVHLPQNGGPQKGAYLESIDIWWRVGTAAMVDMFAEIKKVALPDNGDSYPSPTDLAFSYDAANDTAAERKTLDEHKMTLTLTTPIWMEADDLIYVYVEYEGAATSQLFMGPARANYTLRL